MGKFSKGKHIDRGYQYTTSEMLAFQRNIYRLNNGRSIREYDYVKFSVTFRYMPPEILIMVFETNINKGIMKPLCLFRVKPKP
jgi:hypothetical protein